MALQAIVWDGLPGGRRCDELPVVRPDPGVQIERSQSDCDFRIGEWVAAEQSRPAPRTEELRHAGRRLVGDNELGAVEQPEALPGDPAVGRGPGTSPPLTVRAVAVPGRENRPAHLVAHRSTQAASGQRLTGARHYVRPRRVRAKPDKDVGSVAYKGTRATEDADQIGRCSLPNGETLATPAAPTRPAPVTELRS